MSRLSRPSWSGSSSAPEIATADLSSIETIGYGSAPMPVDRLEQLLARFGPIFTQIYGLTETCAMATVLRRGEHVGARLASCGRAAPASRSSWSTTTGGRSRPASRARS